MENIRSPIQESTALCSLISKANDEHLAGTATRAEIWYILEHPQNYGRKALEESELPEALKTYLTTLTKSTQGARIQLIKRDTSLDPKLIYFFIGLTSAESPRLYEFRFSSYSELLDLDIRNILSKPDEYKNQIRSEPLFLVCTNGKRDPCCAKFGYSFYSSLSKLEPASTWQTSHVGGHRFAANLVCFPHGLFYGRLGDADVQPVLETYRRGKFLLDHYRGRSCFPGEIQAAEYFLHARTGINTIHAYTLERVISLGENRWEIYFIEVSTRRKHQLIVAGFLSEFEVLQSCRDSQTTKVIQYHLETYKDLGL